MGAFEMIERGLSVAEFSNELLDLLEKFQGINVFMGDRPLGLLVTTESEHRLEPHIEWFPWATPRNKIEHVVNMVNAFRKDRLVLIIAKMEIRDFLVHVAKHGILRRVGTINGYFPENAVVFEGKGP